MDDSRDPYDLDGLRQATEKPKRGQQAPDDEVRLEALVGDYAARSSRLSDDEERERRYRRRDWQDEDEDRWEDESGRKVKFPGMKYVPKFGQDIGNEIAHFFETPYEPGYQDEYVDSVEQERNIAALAHASVVLTVTAGIFSAGILVPFLIFTPLAMYFYYRRRSEFIAHHALQAFAAQLIGTVGWLAVIVISAIIGVALTVALAITLVGILAIPFLWLALILFWVVTLAMPLGALAFGIIGALAALQGKLYKYPYISKWFDRQVRHSAWRA